MTIDLKQLLSTEKFLPFYLERRNASSSVLPPVAVELHWTSDCNYDCVHCSYGSRRQGKGRLSAECIQEVIEDLISMEAQAVYLSGGGEPTVVKGWETYANRLIESGIEVALITNGVALRSSSADVLRRMNYIAVSVYSTDESEYHQITDSRFFEKQWSVPYLVKSGENKAIVGARCVINRTNYKNIVNIYRRAKEAAYDYIIFIPAVDYEGRGIGLGQAEQDYVKEILTINKESFDSHFTNALDLLHRKVSHYSVTDYRNNFVVPPSECAAVKIRANAFVNYCGGVWLCQPHIGDSRYQIGNINENRFSEIWNSMRHTEVANLLHDEFSKGLCRNCRSIGFNRAAASHKGESKNLPPQNLDPFI